MPPRRPRPPLHQNEASTSMLHVVSLRQITGTSRLTSPVRQSNACRLANQARQLNPSRRAASMTPALFSQMPPRTPVALVAQNNTSVRVPYLGYSEGEMLTSVPLQRVVTPTGIQVGIPIGGTSTVSAAIPLDVPSGFSVAIPNAYAVNSTSALKAKATSACTIKAPPGYTIVAPAGPTLPNSSTGFSLSSRLDFAAAVPAAASSANPIFAKVGTAIRSKVRLPGASPTGTPARFTPPRFPARFESPAATSVGGPAESLTENQGIFSFENPIKFPTTDSSVDESARVAIDSPAVDGKTKSSIDICSESTLGTQSSSSALGTPARVSVGIQVSVDCSTEIPAATPRCKQVDVPMHSEGDVPAVCSHAEIAASSHAEVPTYIQADVPMCSLTDVPLRSHADASLCDRTDAPVCRAEVPCCDADIPMNGHNEAVNCIAEDAAMLSEDDITMQSDDGVATCSQDNAPLSAASCTQDEVPTYSTEVATCSKTGITTDMADASRTLTRNQSTASPDNSKTSSLSQPTWGASEQAVSDDVDRNVSYEDRGGSQKLTAEQRIINRWKRVEELLRKPTEHCFDDDKRELPPEDTKFAEVYDIVRKSAICTKFSLSAVKYLSVKGLDFAESVIESSVLHARFMRREATDDDLRKILLRYFSLDVKDFGDQVVQSTATVSDLPPEDAQEPQAKRQKLSRTNQS